VLCVWSGVSVVCVCISDNVTLSHDHVASDKMLLFTVDKWPVIHYDNIYQWRPRSSRRQVLEFISSITHKMRYITALPQIQPREPTGLP